MVPKKIVVMAAGAALMLLSAASPAFALSLADSAGTAVPNGSPLHAGPATATLSTTVGNVSCTLEIDGTVGSNPSAAPTVSFGTMAWSGCSDTIPFVTVTSVTTTALPTATLTSVWTTAPAGGSFSLSSTTITLGTSVGSCTYSGSGSATLSNVTNTLSVSKTVSRTSGSTLCPAIGTVGTTFDALCWDVDGNGECNIPPDIIVFVKP